MYNPTGFLRAALPAALEAGKAILEIYAQPTEGWEIEEKADHTPLTLADRRANDIIMRHLRATGHPILSEEGPLPDYEERKNWPGLWVVDPLDGTSEFLKRNDEFTVNIAWVQDGRPMAGVIYLPVTHTLYFGMEGMGAFKVGDVTVAKSEEELIRAAQRLPIEKQHEGFVVVASRSHLSGETEAYIDLLLKDHPDLSLISAGSSMKLCRVAEGSADVYPRFAPTMEWDTAAGDAIVRAAGGEVVDTVRHQPLVYNKADLRNPDFIVTCKS